MTLKEFFAKLPQDGWRVTVMGHLRRPADFDWHALKIMSCCPVTSVCNTPYTTSNYDFAAVSLGLPMAIANRIARAADNEGGSPTELRLRRLLLAHCGLTETAGV
jgi:hypothetical protein